MQAVAEKPELLQLSRPATAPTGPGGYARMPTPQLRYDVSSHTWRPSNRWLHPSYVNGYLGPLPTSAAASHAQSLVLDDSGGVTRPVTVGSRLSTPLLDPTSERRDDAAIQGALRDGGAVGGEAAEGPEGGKHGVERGSGSENAEGPTWQEERRKQIGLVADITQGISTESHGNVGRQYKELYDSHDREYMWNGGMRGTGGIAPRDLHR